MEGKNEHEKKENYVKTVYTVWEAIYNEDEQAVEFYHIDTCLTKEEADKISKQYDPGDIPPGCYFDDTFVLRQLPRN